MNPLEAITELLSHLTIEDRSYFVSMPQRAEWVSGMQGSHVLRVQLGGQAQAEVLTRVWPSCRHEAHRTLNMSLLTYTGQEG